MTKRRKQENLDYVLSIEQEMTSQGKWLSPAFYAVKWDLQKALGYEVSLLTRTSSLELIEN